MISNARFKDFIKIVKNYRSEDGVFIKYGDEIISAAKNSEKQTSGAIRISPDTELGKDFVDLFEEKYIYMGILMNRVAGGKAMSIDTDENNHLVELSSGVGKYEPEKSKPHYKQLLKEFNKYFSFDDDDLILSLNGNIMIEAFNDDNCINLADYYDELYDNNLPILIVSDKLLSSVYPFIKKDLIENSYINIYNYKDMDTVKIVEYKFIIKNFIVSQAHAVIIKGGE